jgi:hypothetical protein
VNRELCFLCGAQVVVLTSPFGGRWFAAHLLWLDHGITAWCAGTPAQ